MYWCRHCNVPLIGRRCSCGKDGEAVTLLRPYDVRPALHHDMEILKGLLLERFGTSRLQQIVLFNKAGGLDRNDLVLMNGKRFGWLSFDPCSKEYTLDLAFEALPQVLPHATQGVIDITSAVSAMQAEGKRGHLSGKRIAVDTDEPDGTVIVRSGRHYGTGQLSRGYIRIKHLGHIEEVVLPDPSWEESVRCNRYHLRNMERTAVRFIRQHMRGAERVNVSFSGGKDSTAVLELARRAGVDDVYFVDTGMEFPETLEFVKQTFFRDVPEPKFKENLVKSTGIRRVLNASETPEALNGEDFWAHAERLGPPRKDNRWCCEVLKLQPVKDMLSKEGECVTVQGNRWYESFSRAELPAAARNPFNPLQLNINPILNWRALEVFTYIWWRDLPCNPLYDLGYERVGCWMCPAMLESEFENTRSLHPELYGRWMTYLKRHAQKDLPDMYFRCGFWRWRSPPPKMCRLAEEVGVTIPEERDLLPAAPG